MYLRVYQILEIVLARFAEKIAYKNAGTLSPIEQITTQPQEGHQNAL